MPGRTALLQTEPSGDTVLPGPLLADFDRETSRFSLFSAERRTARFLRANGVTTVMAEYGPVGVKIAAAARRAGCRLFVHFHGYDATKEALRPGVPDQYRALFAQADGVFVPSRFLGGNLQALGCPPEKITVSPCGVDLTSFKPSQRDPGRLLAVGRFVEKKSPLSTLQALEIALQQDASLHLDMVGEGPLLAEAKAFAAAHLGASVTFHGALPHAAVRALTARAMIFLQHSVTATSGDCEGLPVAILEAMSAEIPVVSTRHSGIPEAVEHGIQGLLVEEHDVRGMADAILTLARDPALCARMGRAGRARVAAEFTADHTVRILRKAMNLPG